MKLRGKKMHASGQPGPSKGAGIVGDGRVVVIGGGISGASAAYRLARSGVRVTLVDRADPGQATAAGAGIVAPGASLRPPGPWEPLAVAAVDFYPMLLSDLAEDGEAGTGYDVVGGLVVATNEDEAARLDELCRTIGERKRSGMGNIGQISRLGPAEARRLFPPIAEGVEAVHVSEGARVDGRRIRDALLRAAVRHGLDLRAGNAAVRTERGTVGGVTIDGDAVLCDAVILAPGAWTASLARDLGVSIPVAPQRGQILHLDLPDASTARWPFVSGFHMHYALSFPEHRVVAGATREDGTGFDHRLTAGGAQQVLNEALRVAPGLAAGTIVEFRIGFRPASPDGLPLIGPVPGVAGAYVASGLGPSGLTLGPLAGAAVADLLLGAPVPFDLGPFDPGRFMS